MAETVGPGGRIVGVDFNPAAVQRARAVVSALELSTWKWWQATSTN
jgi:ubiquinone/menaquinone biosynthesis C-methylase UbiE